MGNSQNQPQRIVGENRSKTEIARFTSTTTWTCPQNVTNVDVWVCGGGGGGASGEWSSRAGYYGRCGSGGCGGECIMYRNIDVTPNQSYNIVIGVGGAGGVKAASAGKVGSKGSNGGQSYFIDTTYSAKGGDGGDNYGSVDDNYTGTGRGGDGGGVSNTVNAISYMSSVWGNAGSYDRTTYDLFNYIPVTGKFGSGSSADFTYNVFLNSHCSIDGDRVDRLGNVFLSGLNPYDGLHYGIGGTGASTAAPSVYDEYIDRLATWSGNMHGGYANQRFLTNPDYDFIHGSVTCGGGGSTGGNLDNYPHAGGNGGSGLIIIYG